MKRPFRRLELATVFGIPAAIAIVLLAQVLEGAPTRALWQPTAALVVFGGTLAAVLISYPPAVVRQTALAIRGTLTVHVEPVEALIDQIVRCSLISRRKGMIALESELDRVRDPFLHAALALTVEGTNAKVSRQILETESNARREHDEAPAEVLETAAGYAHTRNSRGRPWADPRHADPG